MPTNTETLTVGEILKAIDELSEKDRDDRLEHEREEREWQKLYQEPALIDMIKRRVAEAEAARHEGKRKTLVEFRAELEAQGLL